MVPSLSLDYSSQAGDGIAGLGWTLSGLPSISRCPRTFAQDGVHGSVNYDANDRFCMDGQRLIYVTGTGTGYGTDASQYRTEVEGFSKIVEHNAINSSNVYFEVWTKSGQHMEFGNTTDSRVLTVGLSTNVARSWAVDKIADTVGNYLTVTYNCAASGGACTDGDRVTNGEAYPLRIDYSGHTSSPTLSPYNSVQFSYCSRDTTPVCARADSVPMYQAGAKTQSTVLLWDIKTYRGSNLVYDYKLDYRRGTATTHSRVTSVTLCGATSCLAPTVFNWQGGTGYLTPTTPVTTAVSTLDQTIYPADFNGDGLTDIELTKPGFYTDCDTSFPYYYGTSSIGFSTTPDGALPNPGAGAISCSVSSPSVTTVAPNGNAQIVVPVFSTFCNHPDCVPPGTHNTSTLTVFTSGLPSILWKTNVFTGSPSANYLPGDFNGDGLVDFFQQNTGTSYAFIYGGGFFTSDGGHSGVSKGSVALAGGDFDGDGCADLLSLGSSNTIQYFFCNPAVSSATAPSIAGFIVTLGDFNGDGKTDMLLSANGTTGQLWLSTGTGFVQVNSGLPSDWGKYSIRIGDWNGDGKADILLVAPGGGGNYGSGTTHKLFLSTGTDFTAALDGAAGHAPIEISNSATTASATIADWNNDGASDVWIQQPVVSGVGDVIYTYTHTPELITSISNGITSASGGAAPTTVISYDRLNKGGAFYSVASGTTYPYQNVIGALYVVSQVDASNGIGTCTTPSGPNCYTSTYAYTGALMNLTGRGFLGFKTIAITDPQTGIVQTTNYYTGCDVPAGLSAPYLECPLVGLIDSQTKVCPSSACSAGAVTLNSTTNTYAATNLGGTSNFVALTQSVVASNDLNGAIMPGTATSYTYDSYGNALTVNVSISDGSSKSTANTYNNDTTNWFLGRLLTTSVNSIVGSSNLTRYSAFCYDAGTGLLTREVIEPNTLTCTGGSAGTNTLITDYTYDAFGHRTVTAVGGIGITSRTSYAGYDSIGQFQISATNALGQSESWAYDARFAGPTSHTGPNGLTTSWTYDDVGRQTLETRPDGTKTAASFAYCSGVNGGSAGCVIYGAYLAQVDQFASDGTTHIGPTSTNYYDMLSRAIATDAQGFDGSIIRATTLYDANGRVGQSSRPYFATAPPCPSSTPCWTSYTYDRLGRVTLATYPDSSTTSFSFNGLTTSATNSLSQTTTTVKNAQGLKASVTDATSHTTAYVYDAFGNLTTVTDPAGNVVTNAYDIRGNKTDSYDPDMGHWTYAHDVLGELTSQTDAKSQTTTLTYDLLGRALTRTETGLYSSWTYGTSAANHNIGQLTDAQACTGSTCSSVVSDRSLSYDSLGRPNQSVLTKGSSSFTYTSAYNGTNGKIDTVSYPSGFVEKYLYNSPYGYLCRLTDNGGGHTCTTTADSHVLFTVNTRDAEMHLTQSTAGNGVVTNQAFDPRTGLIQTQRAGGSGAVASFDYAFDTIGNLTARTDHDAGFSEGFCYDGLNRLTSYQITGTPGCPLAGTTVSYDGASMGNIVTKSDVGTYSYPSPGGGTGTRPHAVTGIAGSADGLTNPAYTYDGNGNMACVSTAAGCTGTVGRSVSYTAFNMADTITQGSTSIAFTYDGEHHRLQQASTVSGVTTTTVYVNDLASGAMSEQVTVASGLPSWTDYLTLDGQIVAQRNSSPASAAQVWGALNWCASAGPGCLTWTAGAVATTWSWFVLDHLGSVAVVTDAAGSVVQRLSYDAWGMQRNPDGTSAACGSITSPTTRGYTNQEQVPQGCLVNLNARLYNAQIGRFMAADPVVGDDGMPGAFNRYSYVLDNPLSFSDPTGLCFLGCFWQSPVFQAVVGVAIAVFVPLAIYSFSFSALQAGIGAGEFAAIGGSALGGALSGAATTGLSGGDVLKGALFGGLSGAAFAGLAPTLGGSISGALGSILGPKIAPYAGYFIASGFIGGTLSAAQGGNFGSGFLAAGVGSLAGGAGKFDIGHLVLSTTLGGAASVLGGGKFANGAVTAAFSYAATADWSEDAPNAGKKSTPLTSQRSGSSGPFSWQEGIYHDPTGLQGVALLMQYNGDTDSLEWIQSVTARGLYQEDNYGNTFNDHESLSKWPFYDSANELKQPPGTFLDNPGRYLAPENWRADLSAVRVNPNGSFNVLGTFRWGFDITNGVVTMAPVQRIK
jgi:RHS repeat-associated protein